MVFRYGFSMLVSGPALAGVFCLTSPASAIETVPRAIEDEISNVAAPAEQEALLSMPEADRAALDSVELDPANLDSPTGNQGRSPLIAGWGVQV
ncbi:MAG TPA: hypothetical protein ACFE0H_12655, partial [Elainellaceae cyanobacterium]